MNNLSLESLIIRSDWKAIARYQPKLVAESLSLNNGMSLAYKMLFNDEKDDNLRDYATELLLEIRQVYPKEWSLDWRNDVFLGDACYMTMKYQQRYEAYRRAYEAVSYPHPSLLIALAGCYLSPESPVTLNEAENLVKQALEKEMSVEGVVLLRGIYAERKNQAKFNYWDTILKEVEKRNLHTQNVWPDFS